MRGQYGGGEGLSLSTAVRLAHDRNDDADWHNDFDNVGIRLGYRVSAFSASLGWNRLSFARRIDQRVSLGASERLVPVDYDVATNAVDLRVIWSFVEGWRLGGHARYYDSDGSFSLERSDASGWLERELGERYVAHLGVRRVDYTERLLDLDDYDATMLELSFGYRW